MEITIVRFLLCYIRRKSSAAIVLAVIVVLCDAITALRRRYSRLLYVYRRAM